MSDPNDNIRKALDDFEEAIRSQQSGDGTLELTICNTQVQLARIRLLCLLGDALRYQELRKWMEGVL
jgi:hypothetical protein